MIPKNNTCASSIAANTNVAKLVSSNIPFSSSLKIDTNKSTSNDSTSIPLPLVIMPRLSHKEGQYS